MTVVRCQNHTTPVAIARNPAALHARGISPTGVGPPNTAIIEPMPSRAAAGERWRRTATSSTSSVMAPVECTFQAARIEIAGARIKTALPIEWRGSRFGCRAKVAPRGSNPRSAIQNAHASRSTADPRLGSLIMLMRVWLDGAQSNGLHAQANSTRSNRDRRSQGCVQEECEW